MRNHVPALPIESTVIDLLAQTLAGFKDIGKLVERHVKEQECIGTDTTEEYDQLKVQESKLTKRLNFIYSNGDGDEAALKETIDKIKDQLVKVRQSISIFSVPIHSCPQIDATDVRDTIVSQLSDLHNQLPNLPVLELRKLLAVMLKRLSVDIETRDLECEVHLPSWAMSRSHAIKESLCVDSPSYLKALIDAQDMNGLLLAKFSCRAEQANRKQPLCYQCRRVMARTPTHMRIAA